MFCPKCGSNQSDGKKFCTGCGTNLFIVSQALTGQLAPSQPVMNYVPPAAFNQELERHKETRKGITMAVLGGSFLVYQLINFIFSTHPFMGGPRAPFNFYSFIAFIVCAVGISKIVGSRVAAETLPGASALTGSMPPAVAFQPLPAQSSMPQPVFSAGTPAQPSAPRTNELEPAQPAISVTEEETKHLKR
ncbi:MAG: zinc-ribbon domain-containing protein [Blastocatellia bacterium]